MLVEEEKEEFQRYGHGMMSILSFEMVCKLILGIRLIFLFNI